MKKKHRFWSSTTNEHREIISMAKNEYGDFIFTLDGGEIWQFTPHKKIDALEVERMYCMGRGRDSKTGAPSVLSFVVLKNPKESFTGNIRILPRQPEPTATASKKMEKTKEHKLYSATALRQFADLWNASAVARGKPPLVRNFIEDNKARLQLIGVNGQADARRIKDAARHARLLKKWNKRKSSGKKRQA